MRPALAALTSYIGLNRNVVPLDLYTFALVGGTTLRFTSGILPLMAPAVNFPGSPLNYFTTGSNVFLRGPRFGRSKVSTKIGIEPTELDIEIYAGPTDLIGTGLTWQGAMLAGEFDGASVELDRYFLPAGSDGIVGPINTTLGAVVWFYGRVGEVEFGRSALRFKIKSLINLIAQQQMPRRLFQSGCTHIFGDPMCGYNRQAGKAANGTVTGIGAVTITAITGSNQAAIVNTFTPSPTTAYDQGTIIGLTGANAGVTRTINQVVNGPTVDLRTEFPYAVAVGDTFQLLPGCDHTLATCNNVLKNILRFGGMPYIPPPELSV